MKLGRLNHVGVATPSIADSLALYARLGFREMLLPGDRATLAFSEPEVAFLFPAPLSRVALINYSLLRAQLGIFVSAFVMTLVFNRGRGLPGSTWQHATSLWLLFATLRLHFLGASFVHDRVIDTGIRPVFRWLASALIGMKIEIKGESEVKGEVAEALSRMLTALARTGVSVLMTSELEDRYNDLRFSPYGTAFLTDAIIVQRYIEVESRLLRVMAVVKVRASMHSNQLHLFEIGDDGIRLGPMLADYEGLLGGRPTQRGNRGEPGIRIDDG